MSAFNPERAFSGFSVDDLDAAEDFYGRTLGLRVDRTPMGLQLHVGAGPAVFVYPKGDAHAPATCTLLNFPVADLRATVAWLRDRGVELVRYPGLPHDADGVVPGDGEGPDIGWFTDPAGNVLSVLQE